MNPLDRALTGLETIRLDLHAPPRRTWVLRGLMLFGSYLALVVIVGFYIAYLKLTGYQSSQPWPGWDKWSVGICLYTGLALLLFWMTRTPPGLEDLTDG